ncbi:outer membrane protein assembly factor BamB [Psychromonas sp. RZ22]|uniref:outer membrane protein assembly factor BamB n=1 Tax=Psychromonas algarum TaxID=2555643 RepID=UPI001067B683|nr:outer membrane protein assembly factor BamB [Psychromonas sp. RZ22]TEW54895.1 outer membrane protein assembly factor BamB [Psychromonas sp. RZ22]
MIKWVKKLTIITTTTLVLSGCSLFSGEEDVVKMADLPEFEATYEPQIAWTNSIGDGVGDYYSQLKPAVDSDAVYVAERDGKVKAFSVEGGSRLWTTDLNDDDVNILNTSARVSGGVGLGVGAIYIGTENAQVFALDTETGEIKWMSLVSGEVIAQPIYDAGLVVVHTSRGDLIALDSETGDEVWNLAHAQPKLTLRGSSTPSISQGGVIYGRSDGYVTAALLKNGQPLWQLPVARPYGATELERLVDVDMDPIIVNGTIYALAYNGNLVAIDLLKGVELWSRKYSGFKNMAVAGLDIFLTDYRGYVYAVNRSDGKQRWVNKELSYRNVSGVAIANQFIVVGDEEGYLHWIDRETGDFVAQQDIDSDGLYIEPVVTATHLYLQTRSGKLVAIEKPILNVE